MHAKLDNASGCELADINETDDEKAVEKIQADWLRLARPGDKIVILSVTEDDDALTDFNYAGSVHHY